MVLGWEGVEEHEAGAGFYNALWATERTLHFVLVGTESQWVVLSREMM